jgi:germination protein M
MKYRKLWLLLAAILTFALAGCGLFGPDSKTSTEPIDPPPDFSLIPIMEQDDLIIDESANNFTVNEVIEMSVYFVDEKGLVVPMGIQIPKAEGIAKETLRYMTKGGPVLNQIAGTNLEPVLPNGTKVLGLSINEGVAKVDFSKEFLNNETKDQEKRMIEAVVWTLTEFPTIESVQFVVEGYLLEAMPVGGMTLTEPVSRTLGINVEVSGQANIGSPALTSQVMLYFQAVDSVGSMYYVPVTRIIPRTDNQLEAVINETLKGPIHDYLYSAMIPTTKINTLDKRGSNLQIDFDDRLTTYGPGSDGEISVVQSLVLGLTELKDIEQVNITINGETPVFANEENVQPMTRPQVINRIGL